MRGWRPSLSSKPMAAAPEATAALSELIAVVAQLRNPEGGCPWDL